MNVHYCKGHVETVDTKDQSNAIVYWVWYLVCWHCQYEDQSMQCIECYAMLRLSFSHLIALSIRCCVRATNNSISTVSTNIAFNELHALIFLLTVSTNKIPYTIYYSVAIYYICRYCQYRTRISNAFNAIYVDTVDTKHIHTFLPITFLIFNWFSICKKFWKADTKGFSTIPSILYMSILLIQDKDLMHSMLCMSTQLIQMTYTFVLITSLIFNQFSIRRKVLESWDLGLFNHAIKYYMCWHCRH